MDALNLFQNIIQDLYNLQPWEAVYTPKSHSGTTVEIKKGKLDPFGKKRIQLSVLMGVFLLFNVPNLHGQNEVEEKAFQINAAIKDDFGRNLSGGLKPGNAFLGNIDLIATFNTEKAHLWKSGTFFIYLLNNHGTSLSQYVSDFQGVSNIETDPKSRLYQLWYRQAFKNFSFIIGQHDLNAEFCMTEYGGTFINSSFGIQPDISTNAHVSIFPAATFGTILKYEGNNNISVLAAMYDGNPRDEPGHKHSLNWRLDQVEGTMNILEIHYKKDWNILGDGTYKMGAWSHTSDAHFGFYFIGDQKVYTEGNDENQGLGLFTQLGLSPQKSSFLHAYASFGLHYTGLFKGREDDQLGLAIGNASVGNDLGDGNPTSQLNGETVIELTYQASVNDYLILQPDLQYVINPGGTGSTKNSLVGIMRVIFEL